MMMIDGLSIYRMGCLKTAKRHKRANSAGGMPLASTFCFPYLHLLYDMCKEGVAGAIILSQSEL
jgi:hypothetical protein